MNSFYAQVLENLLHLFVAGPTGTGKSKLIEGLIRELIIKPEPPAVVVIDPGGLTVQALENFVVKKGLEHRTLVLDPQEREHFLGFNPFKPNPAFPVSLQARYFAEAVFTALEIDQQLQQSIYFVPLVQQLFFNLAYILIETNFTLAEAEYLLAPEPDPRAGALIERAKTESVKNFWVTAQQLKPRERQQFLGLAQSRLGPFLSSPVISRMVAQRDRVLDMADFIEQGGIFLANVESYGQLTPFDTKLLANLLVSEVVKACFSRPAYTGRDCYLVIEECGEGLLTSEIGKILRRARKQGLKVILLNQDLSSLRETNKIVFHQLWANTTHKIVFGDLPYEDLELVALEFFGDFFDERGLKAIKDQLWRTFFEPVESTRTIDTWSWSSSSSRGRGSGSGSLHGGGQSRIEPSLMNDGLILQRVVFSESEGESSSSSEFEAETEAESFSSAEVPFYEFKERQEIASREFWQLQELLHLAKQKLKNLKPREIALKARGRPVQLLTVPYIASVPEIAEYREAARQQIFTQSGYYATIEEIEHERHQRQRELTC
jgi:hypothetical protein